MLTRFLENYQLVTDTNGSFSTLRRTQTQFSHPSVYSVINGESDFDLRGSLSETGSEAFHRLRASVEEEAARYSVPRPPQVDAQKLPQGSWL